MRSSVAADRNVRAPAYVGIIGRQYIRWRNNLPQWPWRRFPHQLPLTPVFTISRKRFRTCRARSASVFNPHGTSGCRNDSSTPKKIGFIVNNRSCTCTASRNGSRPCCAAAAISSREPPNPLRHCAKGGKVAHPASATHWRDQNKASFIQPSSSSPTEHLQYLRRIQKFLDLIRADTTRQPALHSSTKN